MGTAKAIAIEEVSRVPDSKDRIPKCLSENRGVHCVSVKKSTIDTSLKKFTASIDKTKMIPMVTATVIRELPRRSFSIANSFSFRITLKIQKSPQFLIGD